MKTLRHWRWLWKNSPSAPYVRRPRPLSWRSARVLEIISPAGFEGYFEELAGIAEMAGTTSHIERMPEIMEKHGVQLR